MHNRPEKNELLEDVLNEASPPQFRTALLGETLRLARRRRRWRQTRNAGGVLAAIVFAGIIVRQQWPEKKSDQTVVVPVAEIPAPKSFQLVVTRPLPSGAVVTTGNFSPVKVISSTSDVLPIATSGGGFRYISDEQLLALVGTPAMLIRTGPDSEELVFANPADRQRLFGDKPSQ
jgi:hypothetical protein